MTKLIRCGIIIMSNQFFIGGRNMGSYSSTLKETAYNKGYEWALMTVENTADKYCRDGCCQSCDECNLTDFIQNLKYYIKKYGENDHAIL